jgi:hypothetical protein
MALLLKAGPGCDCARSQVPIVLSEAQTTPLDTYYQYDIEVWDGSTWVPYSSVPGWTFDVGNLPPEMTFVPSTGTMFGTPTETWSGIVTWIVTNDCGAGYGTLSLHIGDSPPDCTFDEIATSTDGTVGTVSHDFDVTGQFGVARSIAIVGLNTASKTWRVIVYADGVGIYDSGTISSTISTTALVPAGTIEITVEMIYTDPALDTQEVHVFC